MKQDGLALITGASSGIGVHYANILAHMQFNLIIVSNEEAIYERAAIIEEETSVRVEALKIDLAVEGAAKTLYDWVKEKGYKVTVLINNAGIYLSSDFIDAPAIFNQQMIQLHVTTPAMLSYYFGSEMAQHANGYILNCSSITAKMPVQKLALYGSTKRFLKNFSRSLHIELINKGVHVSVVCPGAVATNLYKMSEKSKKVGIRWGYIITPERLAQKAIRGLFRGRAVITPWWGNRIFAVIIQSIPLWILRLIRKKGIF